MNLLRIVLLGLAAVVLVALGWRLALPPGKGGAGAPVQAPLVADRTPPSPASAPVPPPAPAPVTPPAATPVQQATVPTAPVAPAASVATAAPPAEQAMTAPPASSPPPVAPPPPPAAPPPPPTAAQTALDARQKIDTVLSGAPALARAFDVLKAQFPAVAERSLAESTEAFRTSGTLPTPDDLFAKAMHDLRQSAGVLAAKAGPEALGAVFDEKATFLADLQQADPRICADYLFGGTSPEFSDFLAGHRTLVADVALIDIQAMADGRTRQEAWSKPSADDFSWIERELGRRGLSPAEISALLDGRAADPPPPDSRLCENARTYLAVVKTMPSDARDRIYGLTAELLARS